MASSKTKKLKGDFSTNESGDLLGLDNHGDEVTIAESAYLTLDGMSRKEGSEDWSLHCEHRDFDGVVHSTTHPLANLHTAPKSVIKTLISRGLRLMPGMGKKLILFLISNLPDDRFTRVHRTGWLEKFWYYKNHHWNAGNAGGPVRLELAGHCPTVNSTKASGTLNQWKKHIAAILIGNELAKFCVIFGFLGPLLKLLGLEGGGFHLCGPSSSGKTTGLQLGASVYGCGASPAADSGKSFVQSWLATSNGLEAIAAAHTDSLTALDEIGLYAGNDLGSDLYLLAGGRGKGAMNSHRQLMECSSWRGNILSTGEMSLTEAIAKKGGHAKAGMLVRLIDIPVSNMFPSPPEGMTSGELSNLLKSRCAKYYGTAGKAFVEALVEQLSDDPDAFIQMCRDTLDEFVRDMTPEGVTPLQERAIRRFAAVRVAGHVAVEAGILPYSTDDVDTCVAEVMNSWLTFRPSVTDVQRALVHLQDFLVRNGSSFLACSASHSSNPKGFLDPSRKFFLFTDSQFATATAAANVVEVARELRAMGHLHANEVGRLKAKIPIPKGEPVRFYAVKKSFLAADLQRTDADNEVVIDPDEDDSLVDHDV